MVLVAVAILSDALGFSFPRKRPLRRVASPAQIREYLVLSFPLYMGIKKNEKTLMTWGRCDVGAPEVLHLLETLGVTLEVAGDRLRYCPASRVPPDLVEALHQHKPEIMAVLRKPRLVQGPPEGHAKEVERLVLKEGCCIFWSKLFKELVALVKDESYRKEVPKGIAVSTDGEIKLLFPADGRDVSERTLRLINQAKKLGGYRVTDVTRQEE